MKFALTSGTSTMDKGVETYVFGWNPEGVAVYSRLILEGNEYRAKSWLCSLYMYPDRPTYDHLLDVRIERGYQGSNEHEPDMYTVTLKIRRGHLTLASFMKKHLLHNVTTAVLLDEPVIILRVRCPYCEVHQDLLPHAFPPEPRRWLDRS
jgi:hypothetical protein